MNLDSRIELFRFGQKSDLFNEIQVLIASDVLYMQKTIQDLFETVKYFNGLLILVDPGRCFLQEFVDIMIEASFQVKSEVFNHYETSLGTLPKVEIVLFYRDVNDLTRGFIDCLTSFKI